MRQIYHSEVKFWTSNNVLNGSSLSIHQYGKKSDLFCMMIKSMQAYKWKSFGMFVWNSIWTTFRGQCSVSNLKRGGWGARKEMSSLRFLKSPCHRYFPGSAYYVSCQERLWVIPCQITTWSHGWHLSFYWNLNYLMPSQNFISILYMVWKLLLFEFCQKLAKIAFCQKQARFSQLSSQIINQLKKQSDWNLDPL